MGILGTMAAFMIQYSWLFFVVAIIAMFVKQNAFARGDRKRLTTWTWVSFCACSLLAAVYIAVSFLGGGAFQFLLAALWCYFAWRDWQLLQQLR